MVRWIQEQMGARGDGCADRKESSDKGEAIHAKKESLAEMELGMQKLVDNLSNAALKERMLMSIVQMADESDQQTEKTRVFLKLASEVCELHQQTEKKQDRERLQLLSEEARLRKALALKNAIFRAYVTDYSSTAVLPKVMVQVEPLSDSCLIPTLVT